jgi:hypothetical protein
LELRKEYQETTTRIQLQVSKTLENNEQSIKNIYIKTEQVTEERKSLIKQLAQDMKTTEMQQNGISQLK